MTAVFDTYAAYYDLLYRDKDYVGETDYIHELIRTHAPNAVKVLELGCGTGIHALHLANRGYRIHGIDQSEKMLAGANAQLARLDQSSAGALEFAEGDIRNYRTNQKFDVVISLFHVLSYQSTNQDVAAAFETAAVHLQRGGLLIFDFWYGPAVLDSRPEKRSKQLEDDLIKLTRIAEPTSYPNDNIVDVNYQIIVEDKKNGHSEKFTETHRMRYFFKPELEQYLAHAGFESLQYEEWLTRNPLSEKSWGAVLVARRL